MVPASKKSVVSSYGIGEINWQIGACGDAMSIVVFVLIVVVADVVVMLPFWLLSLALSLWSYTRRGYCLILEISRRSINLCINLCTDLRAVRVCKEKFRVVIT